MTVGGIQGMGGASNTTRGLLLVEEQVGVSVVML